MSLSADLADPSPFRDTYCSKKKAWNLLLNTSQKRNIGCGTLFWLWLYLENSWWIQPVTSEDLFEKLILILEGQTIAFVISRKVFVIILTLGTREICLCVGTYFNCHEWVDKIVLFYFYTICRFLLTNTNATQISSFKPIGLEKNTKLSQFELRLGGWYRGFPEKDTLSYLCALWIDK